MPTPPRTYSAAAAEKLRLALLTLAAAAATPAVSQVPGVITAGTPPPPPAGDARSMDIPEPDVIELGGEIPEDIETGGDIGGVACPKEGCDSEDCWCDGPCEEGKPCTDCDTQGDDGKEETHAENAESAESQSHAENAENAETESHAESAESQSHAENAESAESKTHAESAEGAESGEGSGEAKSSPSVAPAAATNAPAYSIAVETLSRALSAQAGYPITPELIVQAAKIAEMELEGFAREKLSELGIEPGATIDPPAPVPTATNATATPPPARLGGRRYPVPRTNP